MADPFRVVRDAVESGVFPGAQLAASREGKVLADIAMGQLDPSADAPRVTEQTQYDLASLTKPLATAMLVGQLAGRGLISFDSPMHEWLPGVDPRVRVRDALAHAAGWPAHRRFDLELPAELELGSWSAFRSILSAVVSTRLDAAPGVRSVYSDLGFIALGALIERVLGAPMSTAFRALVRPEIGVRFRDRRGEPAILDVSAADVAPTEDGLVGMVHDENARAMGGAAGHAGLFGTARGVLSLAEDWVRAYHGESDRTLSPEIVRAMVAGCGVEGSTRTLGWDRPSVTGSSTGGRWPSHSVGHLGFTGTSLWIEPERALVVVLVSNRVCPTRRNEKIKELRPRLYDAAWEAWHGGGR